jgi:mutator protein MutT
MIEVVCAFLQNNRGEYLLVQRSADMPHPGSWEFAGGKVQPDERYEDALTRELEEELQLEVDVVRKGISVEHHYKEKSITLIPFYCQLKGGTVRLTEHQAFVWLKADALAGHNNLLAADVALLEKNKL